MQQFAVRQINEDTHAGKRMKDPQEREPGLQFLKRVGPGRDEKASDKGIACELRRNEGETESLQHEPRKGEPEKKKKEKDICLVVNLLSRTEQKPSHTGYHKSEKKGESEAVAPDLDKNISIPLEEIARHTAAGAKIT